MRQTSNGIRRGSWTSTPLMAVVAAILFAVACLTAVTPAHAKSTPLYPLSDDAGPVRRAGSTRSNVATSLPQIFGPREGAAGTTSQDPCACAGGVVNGKCYSSLARAIDAAKSGDTVIVGGGVIVTKPIGFNIYQLTVKGISCGGKKALVVANMDSPAGGILMPAKMEHDIILQDITFKRAAGSGYASALRAYNKEATISLQAKNCDFIGMKTKAKGGSALFLANAGDVLIDNKCVFSGNVVDTKGDDSASSSWTWGGGGALYITNVFKGNPVNIFGSYSNNEHLFQHGLGGAICIDFIEGKVNIKGRFTGNTASDGGAVHVDVIDAPGVLNVDGVYKGNKALDYGLGCRGAAVRPQFVYGTVNLKGEYTGNYAQCRGGVFASNRLTQNGTITISGTYINNVATGMGGVFSLSNQATGLLTVEGSSIFQGNQAKSPSANILNVVPGNFNLGERKWNGTTITYSAPANTTIKGNDDV